MSAERSGPVALVQHFQEQLLAVMKEAKTLTVSQRYDRLLPTIEESFSLPIMIGSATGSYWKQATAEEKARLVTAFKRKNISTVATLFDGYSGQEFKIDGEKPAPQNTRLVETRIVSPDGSSVNLDYRVIEISGRWWIIDVIVDKGISEMSVRRSEYSDTLKKKGLAGLTNALGAKADELLAK
jgi:phospholipid transport system substrate-binding protein